MSPSFDRDREEVLAAAAAVGVTKLIITGSTIEDSEKAENYVNTNSITNIHVQCKTTAGVHPHNAKHWNAPALTRLRELVLQGSDTIAAIGECGLDYNRNFSPPDTQRSCFEDQLALAAELGKSVFLHERDAHNDFSAILKKYRSGLPGAVVHCFTGTAAELEVYLAMDCYIGITGWICDERRGSHLIPLLRQIPVDRLLLETDAPYLIPRNLPGPRSKRNRNEPRFLPHIAAFAANALEKTPEQIAGETTVNATRLFGL
ncbi:MAG: TatD family hydrolase [Treponema sp.]|nr:TatD family hydrolase [Treponema sp.]